MSNREPLDDDQIRALIGDASRTPAPLESIRQRATVRRKRASIARVAVVAIALLSASAGLTMLIARTQSDVVASIDVSPGAFAEALRAGDLDAVSELLISGADPDLSDGRTPPVVIAVARDDAALLQLLIDGGANVEATDGSGVRALHRASAAGNLALIDALLAAGADIAAIDPLGRSPLSFALEGNDLDIVDRLLTAGADPNDEDINGRTSLYWAVAGDADLAIIDRLLAAGADPDAGSPTARDAAGSKPVYLERFE